MKRLLAASLPLLLAGCNLTVLDPKGMIAAEEKTLILVATGLMLLVVIPVIIMTLVFAWKYRSTNTRARYEPDWSHSNAIEAVVWLIPCLIIVVLGWITYKSTHALDPYKPIQSDVKPITVEAVSLDWKWLFIYPELKIATVNQLAIPANTPINFKITSDTVMNAFFIPQLGSQVYAMAGMQTKLHLIANETGVFDGDDERRVRCLGQAGPQRPASADQGRLRRAGQAEREGAAGGVRLGRSGAVSQHPAQIHGRLGQGPDARRGAPRRQLHGGNG